MSSKKQKQFVFRNGSRLSGIEANTVGGELDRIREANGELTPENTVDGARRPDSPIHVCFEWDDCKAAHEHRLLQARNLIRSICIVNSADDKPTPVYYHVETGERRSYEPIEVLVNRPDYYAAALEELVCHVARAKNAVGELRRIAAENKTKLDPSKLDRIEKHLNRAEKEAAD